jgi:hypothetical protein
MIGKAGTHRTIRHLTATRDRTAVEGLGQYAPDHRFILKSTVRVGASDDPLLT